MDVDFQGIQKAAHLGRHKLARGQQRMHGQRLAEVIGQQAFEQA